MKAIKWIAVGLVVGAGLYVGVIYLLYKEIQSNREA